MAFTHIKYKPAVKLRKAGYSYSQISKSLSISKGTLSYWFANANWSQLVSKDLNSQWSKISRQKVTLMNSRRKQLLEEKYEKIRKQAKLDFDNLIKNPLFLIGLSLYWGEGDKATKGRVAVINSDPRLLKIVVHFYREVLKVPESKLRAAIFIYQDHNEKSAKEFWSNELKIRSDQFIKTQILPSRSRLTKRKTRSGMCSVYFSSTELSIKIHEWIKILAKTCGNSSVG